jgi:hypothetical protein
MVLVVIELHSSWKCVVLTKLQLNCNELHHIYDATQPTCLTTFIM